MFYSVKVISVGCYFPLDYVVEQEREQVTVVANLLYWIV